MAIELPSDVRERLGRSLREYFAEHFEQDIGDLQTGRLIDFTLGSVGAIAYNQGINDAQAYLQGKLLDLEIDVHETIEYETKKKG